MLLEPWFYNISKNNVAQASSFTIIPPKMLTEPWVYNIKKKMLLEPLFYNISKQNVENHWFNSISKHNVAKTIDFTIFPNNFLINTLVL